MHHWWAGEPSAIQANLRQLECTFIVALKCLELKAVSLVLQHLPFREGLSCSYSNGQHDGGGLPRADVWA